MAHTTATVTEASPNHSQSFTLNMRGLDASYKYETDELTFYAKLAPELDIAALQTALGDNKHAAQLIDSMLRQNAALHLADFLVNRLY